MLQVGFERHEVVIEAERLLRLAVMVRSDEPIASPSAAIECPDGGLDPAWFRVLVPATVPATPFLACEVVVQTPPAGAMPAPGRYRCRLRVWAPTGTTGVADCVLTVERPDASRSICTRFPSPPTIGVDRSGALTATVPILNCGPLELEIDLSIRRGSDGALCGSTSATISAGDVGWIEVPLTGAGAEQGVTFELTSQGLTFDRAAASVPAAAAAASTGAGQRRSWVGRAFRWLLGLALAAAVAIVVAALLDTEEEPPGAFPPEPTTSLPDEPLPPPFEGPVIDFFAAEVDQDFGFCSVYLVWEATNTDLVELFRDGEPITSFEGPVGEYEDEIDGGVEAEYMVVAFGPDGEADASRTVDCDA